MWQPPFLRISSLEAVWPQTSWIPKIYPKPSYMVKFWSQLVNWGLRYWAASIYKSFFFRGYMASNIMESQNISKMLPYEEVLVLIGKLGPEILDSLHIQEFPH